MFWIFLEALFCVAWGAEGPVGLNSYFTPILHPPEIHITHKAYNLCNIRIT